MLNGDADWFERQAKAIRWDDTRTLTQKQRAQFNAKVVQLLEHATYGTQARQIAEEEKNERRWLQEQKRLKNDLEKWLNSSEGRAANQDQRQTKWAAMVQHQKAKPYVEDLTLTPAGKFTDATANDIFNALRKRELPNGHLLVEDCLFENKERVMEAIHDTEKRLQFELRNWRRKNRRSG